MSRRSSSGSSSPGRVQVGVVEVELPVEDQPADDRVRHRLGHRPAEERGVGAEALAVALRDQLAVAHHHHGAGVPSATLRVVLGEGRPDGYLERLGVHVVRQLGRSIAGRPRRVGVVVIHDDRPGEPRALVGEGATELRLGVRRGGPQAEQAGTDGPLAVVALGPQQRHQGVGRQVTEPVVDRAAADERCRADRLRGVAGRDRGDRAEVPRHPRGQDDHDRDHAQQDLATSGHGALRDRVSSSACGARRRTSPTRRGA
jgi:hypothetical protein